jgi:hypothetical protein
MQAQQMKQWAMHPRITKEEHQDTASRSPVGKSLKRSQDPSAQTELHKSIQEAPGRGQNAITVPRLQRCDHCFTILNENKLITLVSLCDFYYLSFDHHRPSFHLTRKTAYLSHFVKRVLLTTRGTP